MSESAARAAIEPAIPEDRPAIFELLAAAGLPLAGLDEGLGAAVVAREDGAIVGCAAVEVYGPDGILRSVCVAPERRGAGLGEALVRAAESLARVRGIETLYLLTETATEWFPRLGYATRARSEAPAAIAASVEFAEACPVSAAFMAKRL